MDGRRRKRKWLVRSGEWRDEEKTEERFLARRGGLEMTGIVVAGKG